MNIKRIAQDSSQNIIRFDKEARIEIFIEEWEIEANTNCINVISNKNMNNDQKIAMLKDLCAEIAYEKLREAMFGSGIQITVDGLSSENINIDRIRWENVLDPDHGL